MTPEQALAAAADLLETYGWCQNHWGIKREEPHCLLGALAYSNDARGCSPQWIANKAAIQQELGQEVDIISWNNTPGRTAEEVITTLRNAKRWL